MSSPPTNPQAWFYAGREAFAHAAGASAAAARAAADAVVARSPLREQRQCGVGCSACCHYPVGVTASEIAAIAVFLREQFSAAEFTALRAQVGTAAARQVALSWEEQAALRAPCVLLGTDRRCRVYSVRPVACRGWNALDRRACEASLAGEAGAVLQPDGAAYAACLGVVAELRAAEVRLGDDGGVYELTSALQVALDGRTATLAHCKRAPGD